jgi:hypothetical protein
MGLIGPKMTLKELADSANETNEGRGEKLALPGVKADAKTADPKAFQKNLLLAERIRKAVAELKGTDKDEQTGQQIPRFVLGWRLYPNADSAYWKTEALLHACGCSGGCFAPYRPGP